MKLQKSTGRVLLWAEDVEEQQNVSMHLAACQSTCRAPLAAVTQGAVCTVITDIKSFTRNTSPWKQSSFGPIVTYLPANTGVFMADIHTIQNIWAHSKHFLLVKARNDPPICLPPAREVLGMPQPCHNPRGDTSPGHSPASCDNISHTSLLCVPVL